VPKSRLSQLVCCLPYVKSAAISAALLASTLSACGNKSAGEQVGEGAAQAPQEVSFITANATVVNEFSELQGRLNSVRVAQVRARVPGVLVHQVQGGMDVKQGQLLFRIDPEPLQAAYNSAEANLQKSLAIQTQAQAKSDRFKSLVEFNAVSKQDYIDATASSQTAVADVAANRAALQTAKLNLGYATITAPITGYMGRPQVTEGDLVGQGEATLLATVQQLDPIYLDLTQSSNEVLRIRRAMEAGKLNRVGKDEVRVTLVLDDGSQYPLPGKLLFSDISVDPTTSMDVACAVPQPGSPATSRHVCTCAGGRIHDQPGDPVAAACGSQGRKRLGDRFDCRCWRQDRSARGQARRSAGGSVDSGRRLASR